MKPLKRSILETKNKFHASLGAHINPRLEKMSMRLRLQGRIRLANRWGRHNPKELAAISIGTLASLTLISFASIAHFASTKQEVPPRPIAKVDNVFNLMNRIDEYKKFQQNEVNKLALQGESIKNSLDSLIRLPVKSHRDSLEILRKSRQLSIIVNNLKSNSSQ